MDIGKPIRKVTVTPLRSPVPKTAPQVKPVKNPVRKPEKVEQVRAEAAALV